MAVGVLVGEGQASWIVRISAVLRVNHRGYRAVKRDDFLEELRLRLEELRLRLEKPLTEKGFG